MRALGKHGLSPGQQAITFYRGALPEVHTSLNNSAGGAFMNLEEAEALALMERVASGDGDWDNERNSSYRVAATTDSEALAAKVEYLTRELEMMKTGQSGANVQAVVEDVNYVHQGGNRNFSNYRPNHGGGNYNQYGNKVHPNISYGNPNNALQPPPGFSVSDGIVTESKKPSTEEVLVAFMSQIGKYMEKTDKFMEVSAQRLEKVENDVQSLSVHLKSIDTQIGQISQAVSAMHHPGRFPGSTMSNPKDCKAIHLRSCKGYENPTMPADNKNASHAKAEEEKQDAEEEQVQEVPLQEGNTSTPPNPPLIPVEVRIPFPQRVQKKKMDD